MPKKKNFNRANFIEGSAEMTNKQKPENIVAIPIAMVAGLKPTDNGSHALVKLAQSDGNELVLAIPPDQLNQMIDGFAKVAGDARKAAGLDPKIRGSYKVSWWELGKNQNGDPILTLTFGSGGRLDFALDNGMLGQIRETINVMLGGEVPKSDGKPS